jgi:hypothetical protein
LDDQAGWTLVTPAAESGFVQEGETRHEPQPLSPDMAAVSQKRLIDPH